MMLLVHDFFNPYTCSKCSEFGTVPYLSATNLASISILSSCIVTGV